MDKKFLSNLNEAQKRNDRAGYYNAVAFLPEVMEVPTMRNNGLIFVAGDQRQNVGFEEYINGAVVGLTAPISGSTCKNRTDVRGTYYKRGSETTFEVEKISKYYSDGWIEGHNSSELAKAHRIFRLSQIAGGDLSLEEQLDLPSDQFKYRYLDRAGLGINTVEDYKAFLENNKEINFRKTGYGFVCLDKNGQGEEIYSIISGTDLPSVIFQLPGNSKLGDTEMDERYCEFLAEMTGDNNLRFHTFRTDRGWAKAITRRK